MESLSYYICIWQDFSDKQKSEFNNCLGDPEKAEFELNLESQLGLCSLLSGYMSVSEFGYQHSFEKKPDNLTNHVAPKPFRELVESLNLRYFKRYYTENPPSYSAPPFIEKILCVGAVNRYMISGKIGTSASRQSSTILFQEEDTPSDAYSALTDAVLNAQSYPEYSQVDIDNLSNGSVIGEAEYDEEENEVVSLELYDWVLNEHGFEA